MLLLLFCLLLHRINNSRLDAVSVTLALDDLFSLQDASFNPTPDRVRIF